MNENIVLYRVIAYAGMLWLLNAVVLHAGDFIAYLIKKLEEGGAQHLRPRAKTSPKKRRQPAAAA